jgi:hypothetical protein
VAHIREKLAEVFIAVIHFQNAQFGSGRQVCDIFGIWGYTFYVYLKQQYSLWGIHYFFSFSEFGF